MKTIQGLLILSCIAGMGFGCGKKVNLETKGGASSSAPTLTTQPSLGPKCDETNTKSWAFAQPEKTFSKMDLLFVVDTSKSIWDEYAKIATQIVSFMKGLPAKADLNIAILPGHGFLSRYSGKLHAAKGNPKFINTLSSNPKEVEKQLAENFKNLPFDITPGGGEYLFYSYARSTSGKNLKQLQKSGFLRNDALFTAIFVSDENDICFSPKRHGYDKFPDFVPSLNGMDEVGYLLFCNNSKKEERYTPEKIKAHTEKFKGADKYNFGAIVHADKAAVPQNSKSEDSIGHGFLELVRISSPRSHAIEITSSSYDAGLLHLARVGSGGELFTRFNVGLLTEVELKNLVVSVDGVDVHFNYEVELDGTITVVIDPADAGKYKSAVAVSACSV